MKQLKYEVMCFPSYENSFSALASSNPSQFYELEISRLMTYKHGEAIDLLYVSQLDRRKPLTLNTTRVTLEALPVVHVI